MTVVLTRAADRLDTQPVRSRWEPVQEPAGSERQAVLGGAKVGSRAWGLAWVDTVMELPSLEEKQAIEKDAIARLKAAEEAETREAATASTIPESHVATPAA